LTNDLLILLHFIDPSRILIYVVNSLSKKSLVWGATLTLLML
jgi:hypothetical protein